MWLTCDGIAAQEKPDRRIRLSGVRAQCARSVAEDRLQTRKDRGKIQVGLCARTEVAT
jgi:hypothetical protein